MRISSERLMRILNGEEKLLFDGAMGTTLQSTGLAGDGPADALCITNPDAITEIHRAYVEAGAQAITTNTFNSNRALLDTIGVDASVEDVFVAAVACARAAEPEFVAADIGPTGHMLAPFGDLEEEDAFALFAEQARAAEKAGVDFILIETIPDVAEAEIAIRAAKEHSDLPVFASMTFEENGFTLMGNDIPTCTQRMQEAGADVVGINCSHGPETLRSQIATMIEAASKPVLVQPNAGMPELVDGQVVYRMDPAAFANAVSDMIECGATVFGSCCGSTPAFTAELAKLL